MDVLILTEDASAPEVSDALLTRACPAATVRRGALTPDAGPSRADLVVVAAGRHTTLHEGIARLRTAHPTLPILVVSAHDGASPAVGAMRAGASDYLVAPVSEEGLTASLASVAGAPGRRRPALQATRGPRRPLAGLIGKSAALEQVRELVRTASLTDAHVLIEGETGTGKEVVARAIHALGRRATGPLVPVNCAAIPEALAESELFGHARGAFTGAVQERPGVLQLADRGTLFLDEVEDLAPSLQAKLLRVVQDREVRPVGGSVLRRVDVRLVAAANRDLASLVEAGTFRRDLFYRLRVFAIHLPPLRERREDLPALIDHFIGRFNGRHGTRFAAPMGTLLRPFLEHPWPGNVRELENMLESLLIHAHAAGCSLDELLRRRHARPPTLLVDERTRILRALDSHRWNRQRAAGALGISRVTLWRRMERHNIRDAPRGAPRDHVSGRDGSERVA